MKNIIHIILCIASVLMFKNSLAQVTTVTFQPGSTGLDAQLFNNLPNSNFGTNATFQMTRSGSAIFRQVLSFDLTSIPSQAIVTSATLTLYNSSAHTGTNPAYMRKNLSSWTEASVTWSTAPTYTTTGEIALAQSTSTNQTYAINVKDFVQEMVNLPAKNFGWTFMKQNEAVTGGLIFASSDHATAGLRPKLEVSYCLPMEVTAYMTPATGTATTNGALNVTVTNGVPPYTYLWSDASTNKDLFNKAPGVYSYTVTDNAGNKVKKDFIIAAENAAMTFTLIPDALSGKDALIQEMSDGTLVNDNNRDATQIKAERATASLWFKTRSLMAFDLSYIPANAVVNTASLTLYGNGHNYTNSNASKLYPVTSQWYESTLTWSVQPSHVSTNTIALAVTTSTNENRTVNVASQIQNWVQNPSSNYGWKLILDGESPTQTAVMAFGSSDHATSGLRPKLEITITIPKLTDTERNWTLEESFDASGTVISSNKVYMDDLGRGTQSLTKDGNGDVLAAQTVFDAYGRPAINTLPAYAGTTLTYKTSLFLNTQAQEYNYTNFDVAGKITSPDAVQVGLANTVGTYYSNSNTLDAWQATATNPYSRTHYLADPFSDVKTTNGPDDAFNASSGREARSYIMVCGDELKFILGNNNSYKVKTNGAPLTTVPLTVTTANYVRATKSITTSPDNKEVISYSVGDKVIATCMSGLSSPDNCSMTSIRNYMNWYGTQSIDIHVPHANKSSVSLPLPTYKVGPTTFSVSNADISYTITDLNTETVMQPSVDYTLNTSTRAVTFSSAYTGNSKPLFLRISMAYTNGFMASMDGLGLSMPSGIVQYELDYGRWSVNYYDVAGNLRKSVSAKGINCSSAGTVNMATVYDYSHLGQLVAKQTPDEGLVEYAYNTDGQPRFSQNAEQKLNKRFSYTSYDVHNRPIESGEFSNLSGSGVNGTYFQNYYGNYSAPYTNNVSSATIIDNTDGLNDTYCNDVFHTSYEELSGGDDIPVAYTYSASYLGKYKNGQVSKTWNNNTTTWYKYDVAGRLFASVKQINDADYISAAGSGNAQIKTYENSYDAYFGYVTNNYYQKNVTAEYAEHQFSYDAAKRLSGVDFKAGSGSAVGVLDLTYDKLGRVSRQVLGTHLQGVDYVYTINGQLKAINHPSLDETKDPGADVDDYADAFLGNANTKKDLFGEIIEYYAGDYTRSGTSIEAHSNGLYNGKIYGSRYKTRNTISTSSGTISTTANYIAAGTADQVELINNTNYTQKELANRYTYDAFGQLANSTFGTFNNSTNTFTARNEYKEYGPTNNSIAYDDNGNITRLQRNAYVVSGTQQLLDNLTYTYTANTNKHSKVGDAATNSYASSFNFKNQSGTPATFTYNANGEMTASPDENITAVTYYPKGQVKQITFSNSNTTTYYYDDQGQKYKTKFFNNATSSTKYTWYIFNAIYEYQTSGTFSLKQVAVGGQGRAGVYKQDVSGLAIGTGHMEYELTDHLGNVRVTFKNGTGFNLEVMSKTDYYAFGGTLPGRIWQQSGGEYRYGYQGQEKGEGDVNWDQFELRLLNHDIGRWSAPDPYAQFHSPYLSMANNPVSSIDPNGGYVNNGYVDHNSYLNRLREYRKNMHVIGGARDKMYQSYISELNSLLKRYNPGATEGGGSRNDIEFLEALYSLNSNYMGMGMSNLVMASGVGYVSQNTIINHNQLVFNSVVQNGSYQTAMAMAQQAIAVHTPMNALDAATQGWINANNQAQKRRVDQKRMEWRKNEGAKKSKYVKEIGNGRKFVRRTNHNAVGGSQNTIKSGLQQGHSGYSMRPSVVFVMDIVGKAGPGSLVGSNLVSGATSALIDITHIGVYGPDRGTGTTYNISFLDKSGSKVFEDYQITVMPGEGNVNLVPPLQRYADTYAPEDDESDLKAGPSYDLNGGTIIISVQFSDRGEYWEKWGERYDQCWNVNFGYTLTTNYE